MNSIQKALTIIFIILAAPALGQTTIVLCDESNREGGKKYRVLSDDVSVYSGPGANHNRVVNEKASKILSKTIFVQVDTTVTVLEECSVPDWSKVRVVDPSYLSNSHRGWIESRFLKNTQNTRVGDQWYSEWSNDFHLGISKVLAHNRIRGCGEFRFRKNLSDANDFIVACTRDGRNWNEFRVSTSLGKVTVMQ